MTFVYISGQLTSTTSGAAYELVSVAQSGTKKLILNLQDLDFIAQAQAHDFGEQRRGKRAVRFAPSARIKPS